jgi:hypothetical protein
LRTANFEQALMRYRFLKGQIQGKAEYYGLMASVNLRIQFLKKQLHLRDTEVAAIPPRKVRIPKDKPPQDKPPEAKSPERPGDALTKTPGEADKEADKTPESPGAKVIPGPPAQIPGAAATYGPPAQIPGAAPLPGAQKSPAVVTSDAKPKEDEKAKEEKDQEESKPAVPPSFWQRLKIRFNLGKKPETVTID